MHTFEEVVKINQCLHGYADGHQLLQTSTKLPPKADQLLLTLSDMSGPSMISGQSALQKQFPRVKSFVSKIVTRQLFPIETYGEAVSAP